MKIDQTFTVLTKGVGAPDYSNTVASAQERRGIRLRYGQYLKIFGRSFNAGDAAYPLVIPSFVAPGANAHLRDFENMADMPWTIPAGYTLSLADVGYTFQQDSQIYAYMDLGISAVICLGASEAGISIYENRVTGLSTAWFDPNGLMAHTIDIKVYNMGLANLHGSVMVTAILEEVGTAPLPTAKECHCPSCANVQTESVHATKITCKNCGHEYGVFDLSRFKGTP